MGVIILAAVVGYFGVRMYHSYSVKQDQINPERKKSYWEFALLNLPFAIVFIVVGIFLAGIAFIGALSGPAGPPASYYNGFLYAGIAVMGFGTTGFVIIKSAFQIWWKDKRWLAWTMLAVGILAAPLVGIIIFIIINKL
jgi:hypothetical protein